MINLNFELSFSELSGFGYCLVMQVHSSTKALCALAIGLLLER